MILVIKGPQNRLKWIGTFCRQKGVEDALDHMCDSFHFVVVGIFRWLYGWGTHSSPVGHRRHRRTDPSYSGTKVMVPIWTVAGEVEVFGMEVISTPRKILPNLRIPSVEKVS